MPRQKQRALLKNDIKLALCSSAGRHDGVAVLSKPNARVLLLAGIALTILQPDSVAAVSLGDIKVQSALGQPLVATTTARIGPGEILNPGCVTAVADMVGGPHSPNKLNVAVKDTTTAGDFPVQITSLQPLYEPMYEVRLSVSCPGTMQLAKSYMVILNLPMTSPQTQPQAKKDSQTTASTPALQQVQQGLNQPTAQPATVSSSVQAIKSAPLPGTTIPTGNSYQVQSGDTLSSIAQRMQKPQGLTTGQLAGQLFKDNPAAFIDSNPNLIQLGSTLQIPSAQSLAGLGTAPSLSAGAQTLAAQVAEGTSTFAPGQQATAANPAGPEEKTAAGTTAKIRSKESAAATNASAAAASEMPGDSPLILTDKSYADAGTELTLDTAAVPDAVPRMENTSSAPSPVATGVISRADTAEATTTQQSPATNTAAAPATPSITTETGSASSGALTYLTAGIAILSSIFLAIFLLGKRFAGINRFAWLPRQPGKNSKEIFADLPDPVSTDVTQPVPVADITGETVEMPAHKPTPAPAPAVAEPAISTDQDIDAAISATADATALDFDLSDGAYNEADEELAITAESPRISLHDLSGDSELQPDAVDLDLSEFADADGFADDLEDPLERTEKYSAPAYPPNDAAEDEPELESEGTMRNLFVDKAAKTDGYTLATEMPGLKHRNSRSGDAADLDATSDLQTLSKSVDDGNPDDALSKTLSQALGLLEKDYEEEMTASQIMEQKEIERALAEISEKNS